LSPEAADHTASGLFISVCAHFSTVSAHSLLKSRISAVTGGKAMPRDGTKLALFIDGANIHAAARALGFDIDYKRLLTEFRSRGTLVRAFYYTVVIEDQEFSPLRPLLDWLDYNGFTVVTKRAKEFDDGEGRRRFKRSMGIELAVDAMELAEQVDEIVLFSGDGDFRALVQAVQRQGVRASVVSTTASQPPSIADELRRQADIFIDLIELLPKIRRE
jgi:uncharacterized LabA/DUF88 family protein